MRLHACPSAAASRLLAVLAAGLLAAPAALAAETLAWENVTHNVGGDTWGYAGVCMIACVPGADEVIAGVSERGLWSSTDGGATWTALGTDGRTKIAHRPYAIVFDPKDPKIFWESGNYGPGVFKTTDGGKSFVRLGDVANVDGLAVDFTDPERKTLAVGLHEKTQSVTISADGGKTWRCVGKGLPAWTNHSTNPIVFDAKTYVINAAGWLKDHPPAIFRTEDGGQSWQQVSDQGPAGTPLVASDGAIYWGLLGDRGLLKSADRGKTWTLLAAPVKRTPIEIPGGRLVAPVGKQLYASTDAGKTWAPLGPEAPFGPGAVAYDAARQCFFISRSSEKKTPEAIARLDMAGGLASVLPRKIIVWDGEAAAGGKAWRVETSATTLGPQSAVAHSGTTALELHVEGTGWGGAGWNWCAWWPKDGGTDISGMKNLVLWVKIAGEKPANAAVRVGLASSGEGVKPTGQADLVKYCPALFDGQWHEVAVPLKDLYGEATGFNPKKAWQLDVSGSGSGALKFSVYLDDIGFNDVEAPAPAKAPDAPAK